MHLQFCLIRPGVFDQAGNCNHILQLQPLVGEDNTSMLTTRSAEIRLMNDTKTNSRIILDEGRMRFPMVLLVAERKVCIRMCERKFMVDMFKSYRGFRVMKLNDTNSFRCITEICSCNDRRVLIGLVNQ